MACCGSKTSKGAKSTKPTINPWASNKTSGSGTTKSAASIFGSPKVKSSFKIGR